MNRLNFNIVRLCLAACVIISHAPQLIDGNPRRDPLVMLGNPKTLGEIAVFGFFLLSGFLITGSWLRDPQVKDFLLKRVLRIYPAFIVCSLVCVLIVGPLTVVNYWSSLNWASFIFNMIRLHAPSPPAFPGTYHAALNGSMWTIFFEFLCYMTVAILGVCRLLRNKQIIAVLFTLSVIGWFIPLAPIGKWYYLAHFHHLVPWFLAGSLLYYFRDHLTWIRLPNLRIDISYGVYLYGWPIEKLFLWYWPGLGAFELSLLSLCGAGIAGFISWKLVEEPFLKMKPRAPKSDRTTDAATGNGDVLRKSKVG